MKFVKIFNDLFTQVMTVLLNNECTITTFMQYDKKKQILQVIIHLSNMCVRTLIRKTAQRTLTSIC